MGLRENGFESVTGETGSGLNNDDARSIAARISCTVRDLEREAGELRTWQRDANRHIERLLADKAELAEKAGDLEEERRAQSEHLLVLRTALERKWCGSGVTSPMVEAARAAGWLPEEYMPLRFLLADVVAWQDGLRASRACASAAVEALQTGVFNTRPHGHDIDDAARMYIETSSAGLDHGAPRSA